jgi:hypothetical protein
MYKSHVEPSSRQVTLRVVSVQLSSGKPVPNTDYALQRFRSSTALSATVGVSSDFTLVGGGAQALYNDAGILLTGSFQSGSSWRAEAKAHHYPDTGSVTAFAVGLRSKLLSDNRVRVDTSTLCRSTESISPSVGCSVPTPGRLIGGGASAAWFPGYGQLLVKSTLVGNTWFVASKAHVVADSGTVVVTPITVQSF